jgi:site-specific DNA-cytosine methylase
MHFACLENSDALDDQDERGESNLDQCGKVLSDAGFVYFAIRVNTRDYGVPQQRRRWYLGVVPRWKLEVGMPELLEVETFMHDMQQLMESFKDPDHKHISLQALLLDDDNPLVTEELEKLQESHRLVSSRSVGEKCVTAKWPWIHTKAFSDAGLKCPARVETAPVRLKSSDWFQALSLRAQQCVIYGEQKKALTLDCSQDIRRCRINIDHQDFVGSITPSQQVWIFEKNRLMVAAEMLAIQAVPLHEGLPGTTMTFKQLAHLAGNAFTGTVCAAHFLACFAKMWPVIATHGFLSSDMDIANGTEGLDMEGKDWWELHGVASSHDRVSQAPSRQQTEVIESSQESRFRTQIEFVQTFWECEPGTFDPESLGPAGLDPESLDPKSPELPVADNADVLAEQEALEDLAFATREAQEAKEVEDRAFWKFLAPGTPP